MQELNEAQKNAREQWLKKVHLEIENKENELHVLDCEKEELIKGKKFGIVKQEEYKNATQKLHEEIFRLKSQINPKPIKPKVNHDSGSQIIKDREQKNLQKITIILSCIFVSAIALFVYWVLPSEDDTEQTYSERAIETINNCLSAKYTERATCSSFRIDNRDVYSCAIKSTKFVFEIKDVGQNIFLIFAINGKARQLNTKDSKYCSVIESTDYDFSNKVMGII